jgi:hypothetical protein
MMLAGLPFPPCSWAIFAACAEATGPIAVRPPATPDGQAPGDAGEERERAPARMQVEGLHHDGQRGREHERPAEALQRAERHDPWLRDPAGRGRAAQCRGNMSSRGLPFLGLILIL